MTQEGCHISTAEAVTDVTVWCYPRERLEGLMDEVPGLARRLLGIANEELVDARIRLLWLGREDTLERVCLFLLPLTKQVEAGGGDTQVLHIPMTGTDIADYLGLTTETVSRTFTRLRNMGALRLENAGRLVECDFEYLHRLAKAEDGPTVH